MDFFGEEFRSAHGPAISEARKRTSFDKVELHLGLDQVFEEIFHLFRFIRSEIFDELLHVLDALRLQAPQNGQDFLTFRVVADQHLVRPLVLRVQRMAAIHRRLEARLDLKEKVIHLSNISSLPRSTEASLDTRTFGASVRISFITRDRKSVSPSREE